ncbi:MAG: hypothetical protein AABY06_02320 [Nanoarchaeota archaeon]
MRNKRGDVPTAILVLGAFAVCALALISFYASSLFVENTFFGSDLIEQMNSNVNEYNFYNSKNLNGEEIREILLLEENFYINEEGRYFEINKTTTDFKFGGLSFDKKDWSEEKLLISVKYYVD